MKILITGCAGFIGFHLSNSLANKKHKIIGIDNLNNYYDVKLKKERLKILKKNINFQFIKSDIREYEKIKKIFKKYKPEIVVNLAAQAGVRLSVTEPSKYFDNNINGFYNILEISRMQKIKHLVFASTSSVYGNTRNFPSNENDNTDNPESFYAATKKVNEILAYSFSKNFNLPISGLRFFTVYGSFGRPDMALFKFTNKIIKNKKIDVFNNGNLHRDFTHIDDIVNSIELLLNKIPKNKVPYEIYNIGSNNPISLKKFIGLIEKSLGKKAIINNTNMQKGDVKKTHANINKLSKIINYKPQNNINKGISEFVNWFKFFHKINK